MPPSKAPRLNCSALLLLLVTDVAPVVTHTRLSLFRTLNIDVGIQHRPTLSRLPPDVSTPIKLYRVHQSRLYPVDPLGAPSPPQLVPIPTEPLLDLIYSTLIAPSKKFALTVFALIAPAAILSAVIESAA